MRRIFSRLVEEGDCVIYPRRHNEKGYARVTHNGRDHYVHRVFWELANKRELLAGEVVMHTCDNPSCCFPQHLKVGTVHDNIADRKAKGRTKQGRRGHRPLLTEEEVIEIKLRLRMKQGLSSIADTYRVSESCIKHILYGTAWRHVQIPVKST